jgi:hypothetical protein
MEEEGGAVLLLATSVGSSSWGGSVEIFILKSEQFLSES